jgi:hypothetical protein
MADASTEPKADAPPATSETELATGETEVATTPQKDEAASEAPAAVCSPQSARCVLDLSLLSLPLVDGLHADNDIN